MPCLLPSRSSALVALAVVTLACEPAPQPTPSVVDSAPPDTTIADGPAAIVASDRATFAFSSSEPGSRFECALDSAGFAACVSPLTVDALGEGDHVLRVRGRDAAGNADLSPATWSWSVDRTSPDTLLVQGPADPSARRDAVILARSDEDGARFDCAVDGAGFAACAQPLLLSALGEGAHRVEIRAVDQAGNVDPSPLEVRWRVDLAAPEVVSVVVNRGASVALAREVVLELAVQGAEQFAIVVDDAAGEPAWQPSATSATLLLPDRDGEHRVAVHARDAAGNLAAPRGATITLDRSLRPRAFVAPFVDDSAIADAEGVLESVRRLSVSLLEGAAPAALAERAHEDLGALVVAALPELRAYLLELPANADLDAAQGAIETWPGVEWVERDRAGHAAGPVPPLDPGYAAGTQWYLSQVRADAAWQRLDLGGLAYGSPAVRVALVDTGVELDHPDLRAALWTGELFEPAANLLGAVDDPAFSPWLPVDEHGHGTTVAGVIAGAADGAGLVGLAPAVRLLPIRASRDGRFFSFRVAAALERARLLDADVVNLSFTLPPTRVVLRAAQALAGSHNGAGALLVQAAGTWDAAAGCALPTAVGTPSTLSSLVLTVAASDRDDAFAAFSYHDEGVDLVAPGGSVTTCTDAPGDDDVWTTALGGTHAARYGSSLAAAMVSGAAALILGLDRGLDGDRDLRAADLALALLRGGHDLSTGVDPQHIVRRLDVERSLRHLSCRLAPTWRDGGDGACVPPGTCAPGHHLGGGQSCIPLGRCAFGLHDGGDGACVAAGSCAGGFVLDGARCVAPGVDAGPPPDAAAPYEDAGLLVEDGGEQQHTVLMQPGPAGTTDIWVSSKYSQAGDGMNFPGGGMDNERLDVGGWDDVYQALIRFDLTGLPPVAEQALLELYCSELKGERTTALWLDRIDSSWDWTDEGTGRDRQRLWWADRPAATPLVATPLPAPGVGAWYAMDLTDLYNAWQRGAVPNQGVQLRPYDNQNTWSLFTSSDSPDLAHRPQLRITYRRAP